MTNRNSHVVRALLLMFIGASTIVGAHAQVRHRPISIPTRDGRMLAGDLYTTDSTVRRPTVLVQTPYNKNLYRIAVNLPPQTGGSPFPWDSAHYNYVVLDWRGFYGSRDANVAGYDRGLDGYDAVEWIAQQDWCDGKVGTWGPSALGAIQFMTARHHPPHLVCAVPLVKDFKTKYTDFYYGGEYRKEHVEALGELGLAMPSFILSHPTRDVVWTVAENNSDNADEMRVPMLLVSGWYDHYPDDIIRAFEDLRRESDVSVRSQHRLIMGPWLHERIGRSEQGVLSYPNASGQADSAALQFFDHYLRELDNGYERTPVMRYYQMGDDEWRSTESWSATVATTEPVRLHFNAGGRLTTSVATGVNDLSLRYDPRDPSPTVGGARLAPFAEVLVGPQDQRELVESRSDVLIYETEELASDLRIAGAPHVEVFFTSDREDTDLAIRLCDVYPDGRSILVTQAIQRMLFRDGLRPQDTSRLARNGGYVATVQLQNLAMTWKAGHRLRLIVSGSNYPQFERNLNVASPLYGGADTLIATTIIHADMGRNSGIILPVELASSGSPAPEPAEVSVVVAPNAARDELLVRMRLTTPKEVAIDVLDVAGRRVMAGARQRMDAGDRVAGLDIGQLSPGAYLVRLVIGDEVRAVRFLR